MGLTLMTFSLFLFCEVWLHRICGRFTIELSARPAFFPDEQSVQKVRPRPLITEHIALIAQRAGFHRQATATDATGEAVAQRLGIPLAEIGEALKRLPDDRAPTAADWKVLSEQWRRELDERINQLTLLRDRLTGCIGCGCLSMEACPLRNQGDVLGDQGPGAHFLG